VSIEVIKVIKEAEEKAEAIKKDAAVQAKSVITNANALAQSILDEAKKTAQSHRSEVLSKAESEGQLLYDSIINDAAKKSDVLCQKANDNMNDAASIILERIVKTSGNN
jgi:V/A-type H+-transporting ATPase subunit G/H